MLKVLFIENEPDAVGPVVDILKREQPDTESDIVGFGDAKNRIAKSHPDIVILDILAGDPADPDAEGLDIRDFIWGSHFCPVIVYSARPDVHDQNREAHPFIKSIQKGQHSAREVVTAVNELQPQVQALMEAKEHVRQSFSAAMRDVAPHAFETFTDATQRAETVKRSGRRRLAALMDGLTQDGTKLACWEQYLCPPISSDIKLADILREAGKEHDDPAAFRLVLTPSCDLVASGGRPAKVDSVLTAKCCSIRRGLDLTHLKDWNIATLRDRLRGTVLTQGYLGPMIPFPCLKGRIPTMAANLRDLEFIPIGDIDSRDKPFLRIASIDSPFRELIAWAYLHIACRPGVPDRDFDAWRDEIVSYLENTGGQGTA